MATEDGDLVNIGGWFLDPAHWVGAGSIPQQVGFHLLYTGLALGIALLIGVPLGIVIGYTGKGETLIAGLANWMRALPTLGALVLLFIILSPVVKGPLVYLLPAILVLVVLAVPPILTGTYAGIQSADPDAVGAARGLGYTRLQILWHVQLPCALPLLISGIRGATLMVVSTATVAAYVGLQGLGRYIIDGRAQADFSQMAGGAIIVAALALALELAFTGLGRLVVSPGLKRTTRMTRTKVAAVDPGGAALPIGTSQ